MASTLYDFLIGILLGLFAAWALLRAKFHKKLSYLRNAKAMAIMTEVAASADMLKKVLGFTPSWVAYPEWEKARFVNGIIAELWPYVDKWCQRDLVPMLEGIFAYYKPDFITSIKIPKFELGKVPAMVTGMKCFPTPADEVILEMDIKFIGDPQVTMTVSKGPLSMSTGFTDVQFFARVRVILKPLTDRVPWFSALSLSFMEPPEMKYDLTGSANMVDAIPGCNSIVDDLITKVLKWVMVWPFRVITPILERTDGGGWDYSFLQPRVQGVVEVHVVDAYDVIDMDVGGGADVSVKLTLIGTSGPMVFKTKKVATKKGACVINEKHSFNVVEPTSQVIRCKLVDIDFGSDDKIGLGQIPLQRAGENPYVPIEQVIDIKKDDRVNARLRVILTYRPLLRQHGAEGVDPSAEQGEGAAATSPQDGKEPPASRRTSLSLAPATPLPPFPAPEKHPGGAAGIAGGGASPLGTAGQAVVPPAMAAMAPGNGPQSNAGGDNTRNIVGSTAGKPAAPLPPSATAASVTDAAPKARTGMAAAGSPPSTGVNSALPTSAPAGRSANATSGRVHTGGMLYCKVVNAAVSARRSKSLYVVAEVDGVKGARKTGIKHGREAKWDMDWEELDFTIVGAADGKRLAVKLMDRDWFTSDGLMGSVSLMLDPVLQKGTHTETLKLQNGRDGEMTLALRWLPY